jgi:hypothetical protein
MSVISPSRRPRSTGGSDEALTAGEGQQLAGKRRPAARRVNHEIEPRRRFADRAFAERQRAAEDHLQKIVEVVGDAAGEMADRLHLLRVVQPMLGALALLHLRVERGNRSARSPGVAQGAEREEEQDRRCERRDCAVDQDVLAPARQDVPRIDSESDVDRIAGDLLVGDEPVPRWPAGEKSTSVGSFHGNVTIPRASLSQLNICQRSGGKAEPDARSRLLGTVRTTIAFSSNARCENTMRASCASLRISP